MREEIKILASDTASMTKRINSRLKNKKSINLFTVMERERLDILLNRLFAKAYDVIGELRCTAYVTEEPLSFGDRYKGEEMGIYVGFVWARGVFDCAWFHMTGIIPDGYKDIEKELVFLINAGGEGLVCDRDGVEKQGITCWSSDFSYYLGMPVKRVVLNDNLSSGGKVDFWIDCAANDLFGKMQNHAKVQEMSIAVVNPAIRALAYDIQVLLSVYDYNPDIGFTKAVYGRVSEYLKDVDKITEQNAGRYRELLRPFITQRNEGPAFQFSAVGHAHLDLAWLWPIRESKRKAARTFTNQIVNIKRYPDYVFGASQAQLYEWVKDEYPRIYAQVKELAKTKNWDVQGATWVEMDSNLIGGESMIRQFFYGKKFFREEFGQEMKIFWVPDSFGYSACLPQVMKLAGVPYFLTQKMSWNRVNKFPYHSFKWQGLDGSEVLAHMLPEDTYNSPMRGDFLKYGYNNYREKGISDMAMILYGIGDGGAGPGFEHIERAVRFNDIKGMPKVNMEKSADFFEKFDDENINYPTHKGELYLEKHQGTYTTQAKNKKYNRKCEFALRNYEMLAAAALKNGIEIPISLERLEKLWKECLLYQFHDILPGSSIDRVYEESVPRYKEIYGELTDGIETLINILAPPGAVVNLNPFAYNMMIKSNDGWHDLGIPALGYAKPDEKNRISEFYAKADGEKIENDKITVKFKEGLIVSLHDRALNREFAPEGGKMGVFSRYKDTGDCWDIKPAKYESTKRDADLIGFRTGTDGAEAFADISFSIGNTTIYERVSVTDGSSLVSFDIKIDCSQENSMLRMAFPVNIKTDECNFNIQFGHIARKTTENNSIEKAQFEVSGQKFVDMSENECGLSLLNDCKYGYRCKNGVMDVDLIRSPKGGPGSEVDQGKNHIKLALLPHAGVLGSETYKQAYLLNNPLIFNSNGKNPAVPGSRPLIPGSCYRCDNDNIILESIKIPEDGNGIIARFYNCSASAQSAKVVIKGYEPRCAADIEENNLGECGDVIALEGFKLINIRFC
ncbi:MAG: hypothetical protein FWF08_07120 [Oscillospiraceae bacterium]|nr:hypothetical protein [Oscillospiraceae bacterium]